jgi:fucose 4-O-acetylase-like acetyltransferase
MDKTAPKSRQRLPELDFAKGLAIFLVVLGHIGSSSMPAGNRWFELVTMLIYQFHMPFFVFLSGAVFQVTFQPDGLLGLARFARSRAARLLPAFFVFAIAIWAAKILAAQFLHVDNLRGGDWEELLRIAFRPSESVATSLWYIYVLFQFCVLSAAILTVSRGRVTPLVVVAALLTATFHLTNVTSLFAANLVCELALFFALGVAFAKNYAALSELVKANSLVFYGIFATSFSVILFINYPASRAVIGACSIPALFAFASSFRSQRDQAILLVLSQYTFTIYLMNTLFIGLFKGVMLKFLPYEGLVFLLYLPVLLAAGVLGPIVIHRLVLSRLPFLGRMTK